MENIMDSAHSALKADAVERLSSQIHESPGATERGLDSALPVSIAGLALVASSERSAGELLRALRGGDYPHLGQAEISPTLADPGAVNRLAQSGEGLLSRIFGNGLDGIVDALAGQSGVSRASATKLLGLSAPLVLDIIGREAASEKMDAKSLSHFLEDQSQTATGALPASVSNALTEARREIDVPSQRQEWRPGDPRATSRETLETARGHVGGAFGATRQRISGAMDDVRERAHSTSADFRHRVHGAGDTLEERRSARATAGLAERRRSVSGLTWLLAALVLVGLLAYLVMRARRAPESSLAPETEAPRLGTPEGRPAAPPPIAPRAEPETQEAPPAGLPEPERRAATPEPTTAPPESTIGESEPAARPSAAPSENDTLSEGSGATALSRFLDSNEPPPKRFVLEVVAFGTGSSDVAESKVLDSVADTLRQHPGAKLRLDGYTDVAGVDATNRQLSKQRAESVKKYLVERGVATERIEATGQGKAQPLDPSATPEANAKNRRVELVVISR